MSTELSANGSEHMRLRLLGLPVVDSIEDLAYHTRLSSGKLYHLWLRSAFHYRIFCIPKKGGGSRTISHPSRDLKALQAWILHTILKPLKPSNASVGFECGDNILRNAQPHIGARVVMSLDLENFFHSVRAKRVFVLFRWLGYSRWASNFFTQLCTLDGGLPQGSPSSPKLANLVCLRLDRRIMGYVGRRGIAYTRYADDLTFSAFSQTALARALRFIQVIIMDEGFSINHSKTRIAGPGRCHRSIGLVITEEEVGIGRKKLRLLRSRINDLRSFGISSAPADNVSHIKGWLAYVKSVDFKRYQTLVRYIHNLSIREPESAVRLLARADLKDLRDIEDSGDRA